MPLRRSLPPPPLPSSYARVSRQDRNRFRDFTQHYILNRVSLAHVFLLVDSGARPVSMDVECALWLHTSNVPYTVLYTKTDSRAEGAPPPEENIPTFQRALKAATRSPPPPYLTTSAKSGAGREDVLRYISQLKQAFKMPLQLKGVPHGEE